MKNEFKKILLVTVIVIASIPINSLKAQEIIPKIGISPHTFNLEVVPGELIEDKIKIINQSDVAMPMKARVINFTAEEETGEMIFDEDAFDPSFTPSLWFEIENPDFILDPGEVEKVRFKIRVPDNAEYGGHYALLVFEPKLPSFYFKEEALVKNIPQIGALFLISVRKFNLEPSVGRELEIVEFSLPREKRIVGLENVFSEVLGGVAFAADLNIVEDPYLDFILRIKNNDIYHLKPTGKVLIYNSNDKRVGEVQIQGKTILPGKTRAFPVQFQPEIPDNLSWLPASISSFLTRNFFLGKYRAEIEVSAKSSLTAEVFQADILGLNFFSLPWKFWLITVFLFVVSVTLSLKYRHRIKRAVKVLLSRK